MRAGPQVATEAVAKKLRVQAGALLQGVTPNGPAAKAGLLPTRRGLSGIIAGDVITAANGKAVSGLCCATKDEASLQGWCGLSHPRLLSLRRNCLAHRLRTLPTWPTSWISARWGTGWR
jgi:hypothetical protein